MKLLHLGAFLFIFTPVKVAGNRKRRYSNNSEIFPIAEHHDHVPTVDSVVKNIGIYWNGLNTNSYGDLTDVRSLLSSQDKRIIFNNRTAIECFKKWKTGRPKKARGTDNEAYDVVTEFFWGQMGGTVLELGAVDGIISSQSFDLEHYLGWHRVLIEANPDRSANMSGTAPEALAFNCAICKRRRTVHFIISLWGDVSGIIEFMSPALVKKMHPYLLRIDESEWVKQYKNVREVVCVPLQHILDFVNISHINFFILDVEGGEMEVLLSINFESILFDVIVVETECQTDKKGLFRPQGYEKKVVAFLAHQGYRKVMCKGRNTWFQHHFYNASAMLAPSYVR